MSALLPSWCRVLVLALSLAPAVQAEEAASVAVFMYHRFGEDRFPSTSVRVDQFRAQLDLLRDAGHPVVPLSAVLAWLGGGPELPQRAVAITVDDAYRSVFEVAFPLLRDRGFPFTVFISTDPVDRGLSGYMSWAQLREMSASGVTFANHGAAHLHLVRRQPGESPAAWRGRIERDARLAGRRLMEELPGLSVLPTAFAYPYGETNEETARLLEELGYHHRFGQQSGAIGAFSDRRALPRYPIAEAFADLGEFRIKANSLPLPVQHVEPWDPVTAKRKPRIEIALGEGVMATDQLSCFVGGQGEVEVEWLEAGRRFTVGPIQPFGRGRQRVNCTAPRGDGRWYWFSHQWVVGDQVIAD